MPNEYSLRVTNLIPFIGQRKYKGCKNEFYEEVQSRGVTSEDVSMAKKWEIRHAELTSYNCFLVIGALLLITNSLDKLVNN